MDAFDKHCNPKKNETVERYKFFSRFQNPGESLEKFITDLKLLATTCNFGDLKDSLVRDRIIQDKQFREDLLKDPCLDLQQCLDACRADELSKERSKTLEEGKNVNLLSDQMKRSSLRLPHPRATTWTNAPRLPGVAWVPLELIDALTQVNLSLKMMRTWFCSVAPWMLQNLMLSWVDL